MQGAWKIILIIVFYIDSNGQNIKHNVQPLLSKNNCAHESKTNNV